MSNSNGVKKLDANLAHRLPDFFDRISSDGNLQDAVMPNLWRATAILKSLSSDLLSTENQIVGEQAHWAIDVVIRELKDIECIINAYRELVEPTDQQTTETQPQKNPEL
jgi:hypothetical protein